MVHSLEADAIKSVKEDLKIFVDDKINALLGRINSKFEDQAEILHSVKSDLSLQADDMLSKIDNKLTCHLELVQQMLNDLPKAANLEEEKENIGFEFPINSRKKFKKFLLKLDDKAFYKIMVISLFLKYVNFNYFSLQVDFGRTNSKGSGLKQRINQLLNAIVSRKVRMYYVPFCKKSSEDNRKKLSETKFNVLLREIFEKEVLANVNSFYSSIWCKSASAFRVKNEENKKIVELEDEVDD
jgi:hypothetical protein